MKKTVLITGTSSGFGKETAKRFQREGWNVIATMRSPEKEQELTSLEGVLVTWLDVQDPDSVRSAIKAGIDEFGSIDALVNNAGYGLMGVFESATKEQIKNQFDVNVFGMMHVTQAVLPYLRKNGGGTIINVSSLVGVVGLPFTSLYASSKFALEGFSEALSYELADLNIAVKIVEPGGAVTNFFTGLNTIENEIPDYDSMMDSLVERYETPNRNLVKATPADVANTIFQAATDKSNQLRYVIGGDAQFYIDTKLKNTEADFVDGIRDSFTATMIGLVRKASV